MNGELRYTFGVLDNDALYWDVDCRAAVRQAEIQSIYCSNRSLYIDRIGPSQLTFNTTLSDFPITSVARSSNQNDFLSVPCQTVQIPPNSLTVVDNTRFDEVNAFYQAREFVENYVEISLGIYFVEPFRILTKVPDPSGDVTAFDPATRILRLGTGDAYSNPGPGVHTYDASKFATVIDHEVSHGLLFDLYGPSIATHNAASVTEGLADYMSSSFNLNPANGVCWLSNYDHVRNADNLPSDFKYSLFDICRYPPSTVCCRRQATYTRTG